MRLIKQQNKGFYMKYLGVLFMSLLATSCAAMEKTGYYKGYELPPYSVSESNNNIEIRSYKPQLVAQVTVTGTRDEAAGKGFRILANYIFGDNLSKENVTMTTPVEQTQISERIAMTTPVSQVADGEKWIIQFGMPKKYTLDTLPKAKDKQISFKMTEPKDVAVVKFSGRWSDERFKENKMKLEEFISKHKLQALSKPSFAYYDDPFTLPWNRRNEILIELKK